MIKAVIFDMDGTLLDTEKYYIMFWPKALEHFGYQVTREQVLTLRSLGRPYAPEHLKKMVGDPNLDYQAVRSYRSKIMEEYLKTVKVDIKPGAVEILTYLKDKNIHRAVATASDLERTTRYLKQFGLYEYFDKIVCAPMVEHGNRHRMSMNMHAVRSDLPRKNVWRLRIRQTASKVPVRPDAKWLWFRI